MILIALGSNITGPWGTPEQSIRRAIAEMAERDIRLIKASSLLETAPFGVKSQPNFVNAVVSVATDLSPKKLMTALHEIERQAGRKREERWGPRTLDLDLLDYNGLILAPQNDEQTLTLPHPGISERSFVLRPLLDVAPDWTHPVTGESVTDMLAGLKPD
jgi:2-amino-4-hydroxy-6-hydroxymethyldihydropteridine diphosphokinase